MKELKPINAPLGKAFLDGAVSTDGLPERYGRNTVVLMARDPEWLFCYWEVTDSLLSLIRRGRPCLRLLGPEGVVNESLPQLPQGKQYIRVPRPGRYRVELGTLAGSQFQPHLRSNEVTTPRGGPGGREACSSAPVAAREYDLPDLAYRKYKESLEDYVSSPGMNFPELKRSALELTAEVVVRGRVPEGSDLRLLGKRVAIGPDGSFSLRFDLPQGALVLPIEVENPQLGNIFLTPVITHEML